ncbi:MAG TPA: DNA polymerase III subunit chi [Verrucomicrobiae bacterium]|nr:DNA polymerase III subunit chi [Verrucomicrobiae bacterium]
MTTRVDFYVLPEDSVDNALATACRLCEKAVGAGKRVHIHAGDADAAAEIDRLLWVYKQGGFIGHERVGASTDPALATVLIGTGEPPDTHRDVLLNLAPEAPAFADRFERVLEVVAGDAATRARSRQRYKSYKDRGFEPETHRL